MVCNVIIPIILTIVVTITIHKSTFYTQEEKPRLSNVVQNIKAQRNLEEHQQREQIEEILLWMITQNRNSANSFTFVDFDRKTRRNVRNLPKYIWEMTAKYVKEHLKFIKQIAHENGLFCREDYGTMSLNDIIANMTTLTVGVI